MSGGFGVSEQEAIERFIRSGSEACFSAVFDSLYRKLFAYFRVRGAERESAEDLAQEVLLVVYRKVNTLREGSLFRGWMFGIARHYLLQYREKQRREIDTQSLEALDALAAGERGAVTGLHARIDLQAFLAQLTGEERELVGLRYVEGLSYAEIAEALQVPLGTVKWRIFQVKSKYLASVRGRGGVSV